MRRLRDLPGLGPKSESWLIEAGITNPVALADLGAVRAFIKIRNECRIKPSMNLLYALAGAIEGKSWLDVARDDKAQLLMELDGYCELAKLFQEEKGES